MKTSKFQIIILILFVVFIVAGVALFATYKGSSGQNQLPPITVWGTFPKDQFDSFVAKVNSGQTQPMQISYVQKSQQTFLSDFTEALARDSGPDAVLIPSDMLLPSEDKLMQIPYSAYDQRTFINSYIDEAGVYLGPQGILGVPFSVDPLVMYWNRDMFNAAGVALTPKYWSDFNDLNKRMTKKSDNGTITASAIALGDFSNVANAREILGTLILQAGNPVTSFDQTGGVVSALAPTSRNSPVPAVTFFSQAVDPANSNYSWNHSWPDSRTAFISGKLATYFGLASEISSLRAKNPNLNFDIAALPQSKSGGVKAVYGRLYAFSIVKRSANAGAVFQIIMTITQPQYLAEIASAMYLPSVSRSVIASGSSDPYISIFNDQALIAKTWLDADPAQSKDVFSGMIQSITSGQKSVYQALSDASEQYQTILTQAQGQ